MKKVIFLLVLTSLVAFTSYADKYESAMTATIEKLNTASTVDAYRDVAASFERIAEAEQSKWLPFYYAGLSYVWASHTIQDGAAIDGLLDQAQVMVDKAVKLSAQNDEIITLQGYIYMMKVTVDPASRGAQYSGMAMQQFGQAVGINDQNPRALMLMGRMQMGTEQFFGQDTSNSCAMIARAAKMFEDYKPASAIDPAWGKETSEMFMSECGASK
ncbi:MAG: hypothetical protein U5K79_20840 [Cyclobacteriaceae bacterium]|nr:hypothetical protein [Cyclobacteriaceae bacterium]